MSKLFWLKNLVKEDIYNRHHEGTLHNDMLFEKIVYNEVQRLAMQPLMFSISLYRHFLNFGTCHIDRDLE